MQGGAIAACIGHNVVADAAWYLEGELVRGVADAAIALLQGKCGRGAEKCNQFLHRPAPPPPPPPPPTTLSSPRLTHKTVPTCNKPASDVDYQPSQLEGTYFDDFCIACSMELRSSSCELTSLTCTSAASGGQAAL